MSNITPSKPNFTFGYWRPWKKEANAIDSWLDYTKDTQLAKYTADTVGSYISEASQEQIGAINSLADDIGFLNYDLNRGFEGISSLLETTNESLSNINESLFFINENLEMQIEVQRVGNVLLGNIAKLLRVPDSEKQRQHHIELGCKFYTNTVKDDDLFNDSLNEFLAAEKLMPQDYFVLHRIGMIYLFSKKNMNIQLALEYFLRAAKYASVESDTDAARLANILTQNSYSQDEEDTEDLYENTSIYTDEELIGQLAAESYEKAALAFYILGDFEQAVVNAQKAKQLNPEPKYGFKLSKYLARTGKSELAVTELNEAIEKLPKLFIGTYNDLDLLNESRILKLLKDKNEEKTNKIIELISFLKTTNTKEDAYYITKLKEVLKDKYENKVALINEVNFVNDAKVKFTAEINQLLNELKTTNKTKYKNYIYNLEQAVNYSNFQKEQLIYFVQTCLIKEKKFDDNLKTLITSFSKYNADFVIKNKEYESIIESDLFSKPSFFNLWEKSILKQNEDLRLEIINYNDDLKNQIEISRNQLADLNDKAKQNEKYENNSLVIGIGGMFGGFIITFIYGILFYDWTNSKLDLNIIGMYLTFGSPIIGLVIQRMKYYNKFDKKENQEKRGQAYSIIKSLENKIKSFKSIAINFSEFKITKLIGWLNSVIKLENGVELEYDRFEKLKFILNDKTYNVKVIDKPNNSETSNDIRDELFEEAAKLFVKNQEASTSLMQRRLNLGYNRANRIMEQLEEAGIVGTFSGSKSRDVLINTPWKLQELLNEELDF
jgi:hypothetical protein